ncbi:MAG: hypothetical protein ICV60_08300 [Pyrinomonadaceae bacterium]|nr:hypothetical protein [Pyrinomonadaceae bacterium]
MPNHPKFLTLAVKMKKIDDSTRRLILNTQRRQKQQGYHHLRAGELLVQERFISEAERDEILRRQESLSKHRSSSFADTIPHSRSTLGWQIVVVFLAILAVAIACLKYDQPLELTIVVVSFIVYVLEAILQFVAGRSISLSLQRAAFSLLMLVVASLILFSVVSIVSLKHDPSHIANGHSEEEARIRTIMFSFSAMTAAVSILLLYSLWKFHALRFSESRLGAIKDILIRVESTLRDESKTLDERQREAIQKVLKGLRNAIRLSLTERIMKLVSVFRSSFNQSRVLYYVKEPSDNLFHLYDAAYPERVSDEVRAAFNWIKRNHHPAPLNEEEFEKQKELARKINPNDWKKSYLKLPERYKHISVCGWIYDKQDILIATDASKCLALDSSFLRKMSDDGFDADILQWVEVGSFVGCRIVGKDGAPAGVLLVIKNIRKGFPPEDIEVVITASQILGRILQAT